MPVGRIEFGTRTTFPDLSGGEEPYRTRGGNGEKRLRALARCFRGDVPARHWYAIHAVSDATTQRRWLGIIPVALVMYTISYVDRTNISLALDPTISSMMQDLFMDDRMKGEAAGIFFFGYVLLQIPGGYWATTWSARKDHQPVPDRLGRLCHRLRPGAQLQAV